MAGSGNAGGDRGDDRGRGLFGPDLKDRIIAALIAVIAGGAGTAGFLNINPPRPHPWTSTQAKEAHAMIDRRIDSIERDDERLSDRVRKLEHSCAQFEIQLHDLRAK